VKSAYEVRFLAAVRITWITAILVCVLAVVSGLLSGTDGSNSSQQFPGFAFADGGNSSQPFPDFASLDPAAALVVGEVHKDAPKTQKNETAGPTGNRGQRVDEQAPGDSHSKPGAPHPGTQPEGAGGRPPASIPGPNRQPQAPEAPEAPTVSVSVPKPPEAPTVSVSVPDPEQAPSGTSALSLPQVSVNVSAPVQTPVVKVPDVSVELP
jgi:hypothetical protein